MELAKLKEKEKELMDEYVECQDQITTLKGEIGTVRTQIYLLENPLPHGLKVGDDVWLMHEGKKIRVKIEVKEGVFRCYGFIRYTKTGEGCFKFKMERRHKNNSIECFLFRG